MIKARHHINELEQYSRRNCLRISGVKEETNEECSHLVQNIACQNLGIDLSPADIDRAHRLGPQRNDGKARQIIVKFTSYDARSRLIHARRKLKGTSIVIREDLTKQNQALLLEVKKNKHVKSVWSNDGKVMALVNKGGREYKKKIIKIDDLD